MECIFCKIIEKKALAEVLFESEHALAILDINPIHYGHVLVIPKRHYENFLSLPKETFPELMHAAQIVAKAIVSTFNPPGFNIFSNNGEAAGQSIFHFHLHVTPRYHDDNIKFVLELKKYPQGEMKSCADLLRQKIQNSVNN